MPGRRRQAGAQPGRHRLANRLLKPFQAADKTQHTLGQHKQVFALNRGDKGMLQAVASVFVHRFRRPAEQRGVLPLCGGGREPAVLPHFGQPAGGIGQLGEREISVFGHMQAPFVINIQEEGQG